MREAERFGQDAVYHPEGRGCADPDSERDSAEAAEGEAAITEEAAEGISNRELRVFRTSAAIVCGGGLFSGGHGDGERNTREVDPQAPGYVLNER